MFNSGIRGKRATDNQGTLNPQTKYVQVINPQPYISGYAISGLDDTALDPAGGQTVLVNGTGFAAGVSATLAGTQIASVTLVSSTQISFTSPAKAGGSYSLVVYNSTGGAAILVPGLTYSSVPTYTTAAGSIGSFYETTAISTSVLATSDSAITYSLSSGSLPSGATLYGNGVITGTSPIDSSSTTYTFDITATDVELQDVTRTFTLTINTDVVSWSTPADGTNYSVLGNSPMSNVALSATSAAGYGVTYAANALPTGLTLSGSTISGTPTVEQTVSTLLTATANTSSRTSTRTISWTVTFGDTYWKYTSLLLSATTPTTTFINDASLNNNQLTIFGDTKPNNFNPYQEGYYSNFFDGTGDNLTTPASAALAFGTGDFTVEFWINFTTTANRQDLIWWGVDANDRGGIIWNLTAGNLTYYISPTVANAINYAFTPSAGVWYHIALVRLSGNTRLYVNGIQGGSTYADSKNYSSSSYFVTIGKDNSAASSYAFGYISNLRVVKGTAVYTSAFTPPTSPLTAIANTSLLTCQSNRLIDDSINNFTITKVGDTRVSPAIPFSTPTTASYNTLYSTYFDGTGDYLSAPSNAAFAFGTGDFTVETFFYFTASSAGQCLIDFRTSSASSTGFFVGVTIAGYIQVWNNSNLINYNAGIVVGRWYHVSIVRSSGTVTAYLNGTSVSSVSNSTNFTDNMCRIGYSISGGEIITGHISNLRVVKGTAIIPPAGGPTSPLTAVANTSLLTCQNATLIDNSTNNFTITSFNQAQPIPVSPFTMTTSSVTVTSLGSAYFDGSGDYLSGPTNYPLITTGPFTIELWVYVPSNASNRQLVGNSRWNIGQNGGFRVYLLAAGTVELSSSSGTYNTFPSRLTSTTTVTPNTWTHIAFVRDSSNVISCYINGVNAATPVTYASNLSLSSDGNIGQFLVGAGIYDGNATDYLNGYISNLRIVNGTAVYTANFTPPQAPLTSITNTQLLTCQYNGGANNNGFIDQSSFNNIIARNGNTTQGTFSPYSQNGWSNYFNGSSYLQYPNLTNYSPGTGDFTLECWVFNTTAAGSNGWYVSHISGGVSFYRDTAGKLAFAKDAIAVIATSTNVIPVNAWVHIAVARSGTSCKLFINGTQEASVTDSTNLTSTGFFDIGITAATAGPTTGYISNVRLVKGTALYTSAFTPSTTPLTAVTNTQFLGCQSNGFIDNSPNIAVPVVGGTPQVQAYSPFGGVTSTPISYSVYLDGTGYVISPASGSANISPVFGLGADNYTVELWVWLNNDTSVGIWDFRYSGGGSGLARPNLVYSAGTSILFSIGGTAKITYNVTLTQYTWYHFAVVRISGVTTLYVDGIARGTYSGTEDFSSTNTFTIGTVGDSPGYATTELTGYVSNVRIVRGIGVYTGAFTVPTSPLQLTQSSGTNISAISTIPVTGNSVYFDGTGDYLSIASNPAHNNFGTSDFGVEGWFYFNSIAGTQLIFSHRNASAGAAAYVPFLLWTVTGTITVYASSDNGSWNVVNGSAAGTVIASQWYHIAYTRTGSTFRVFVNGVQTLTFTSSASFNCSQPFQVGMTGPGETNSAMNGYVSNVRMVKGTAVYTSAFTPPTSPLTAISGTSLLTCQSAILQDNSTNNFTITSFGNAVVAKSWSPFGYNTSYLGFQSFDAKDVSVNLVGQTITGNVYPRNVNPFGITNTLSVSYTPSVNGGSMYFDGTGDYLTMSPGVIIGSSAFTVELWAYYDGTPWTTSPYIPSFLRSNNNNALQFGLDSGTAVRIVVDCKNVSSTYFTIPAMVPYQWNHIVLVRNTANQMTVFVNGVRSSTGVSSISTNYSGITDQIVGSTTPLFKGYMADLKITKGAALYDPNAKGFVPPVAPTTPTADTTLLLNGTSGGIIDYHGTNDLETVGNIQLAPQDPYGGSYYSNYSDGNADYLTVPSASWSTLAGTFTVEGWVKWNVTPATGNMTGVYASGGWVLFNDGTRITPNVFGTGNIFNSTFLVSSVVLGKWYHLAITRNSSNLMTMWVDGVSVGSTTTATTYTQGIWYIFSLNNTNCIQGNISNFRVNNTCLYTTTFTPSTVPLTAVAGTQLLTCQSNRFKDNSTNAATLTAAGTVAVQSVNPFQQNTGKSLYFDGTGDYLVSPSSPSYIIGTGDYTLEFWVYSGIAWSGVICLYNNNSGGYFLQYNTGTGLQTGVAGSSATGTYSVTLTSGTWNYIAVSRTASSSRCFVNGAQVGTTVTDTTNYTQNGAYIGALYNGTQPLTGYIKDLRITKGIARYTATFTPPTTPFVTN